VLDQALRPIVTVGIVRSEELSLVGAAPELVIPTTHVGNMLTGRGGLDGVKKNSSKGV
jgi:hypothetical protein